MNEECEAQDEWIEVLECLLPEDWITANERINENLTKQNTGDRKTDFISSCIKTVLQDHSKKVRKKTNTNPVTKDINYLLRTDPRFAKEYLAASPPEKGDKEFILNQKEHTLLEEARTRRWREMVSGAPDTAELWNFLARAEYRSGGSPRKKVRPTGENKPLEAYGQVATSPKEKARLLTLHFATRGNERTVDPCPETESYLLLPEEDPRNVSPQEVALALSQMNNKSAPGRDKITVPMLVNLPSTHNDIADNFTHIIRGADMPLSMLHVDIITLPKPQKKKDLAHIDQSASSQR